MKEEKRKKENESNKFKEKMDSKDGKKEKDEEVAPDPNDPIFSKYLTTYLACQENSIISKEPFFIRDDCFC